MAGVIVQVQKRAGSYDIVLGQRNRAACDVFRVPSSRLRRRARLPLHVRACARVCVCACVLLSLM